jgi:hypothetical protein
MQRLLQKHRLFPVILAAKRARFCVPMAPQHDELGSTVKGGKLCNCSLKNGLAAFIRLHLERAEDRPAPRLIDGDQPVWFLLASSARCG